MAKVSGQPRKMSLREENRAISQLKGDVEALEQEKKILLEDYDQLKVYRSLP